MEEMMIQNWNNIKSTCIYLVTDYL